MSGQGSLGEKKEKIKNEKYPGTETETWKCGETHKTYTQMQVCTHLHAHTNIQKERE